MVGAQKTGTHTVVVVMKGEQAAQQEGRECRKQGGREACWHAETAMRRHAMNSVHI